MKLGIVFALVYRVLSLSVHEIRLSVDYFLEKDVKFVCYFSCENQHQNKLLASVLMENNMRVATVPIEQTFVDITRALEQWTVDIGVLLDSSCDDAELILFQASKLKLFNAEHIWLVLALTHNDTLQYTNDMFSELNLSIDADVAVVRGNGSDYTLTEVFNFGRIQGNGLEISSLGSWSADNVLCIWRYELDAYERGWWEEARDRERWKSLGEAFAQQWDDTGLSLEKKGFKYYRRWDFHNLTLRAISVMVDLRDEFDPELLSSVGYTPGIAAMTKISSQLLNLLKEKHNFRFNYTVAGRWIGSPDRNSTLGVTNSLLWEEQDVSSTCARIFPQWLNWVDITFPPTTNLQTKFYYIIPDKGVGEYENRFLTPMSDGVWWCTLAACALCVIVLAAAARLETRPKPGFYAFFSVYAAICQQGRKLSMLVVGLTSMLLYNYYTSSVVSWLLNAATPSIDSLDGLINSDLELIFEDIGYSRGWLDGQKTGFAYYYSGFVNLKEDELREKKVTRAKRTVNILQPIASGVELIRSGAYAYHTEPYTASQVISRVFSEDELCEVGSLQMMKPANVYIMLQKRSPYKQFLTWSLMRLLERGHMGASRLRFASTMPACSGRRPRTLALGQAAPAFLMLLQLTVISVVILVAERVWAKFQKSRDTRSTDKQKRPFVG